TFGSRLASFISPLAPFMGLQLIGIWGVFSIVWLYVGGDSSSVAVTTLQSAFSFGLVLAVPFAGIPTERIALAKYQLIGEVLFLLCALGMWVAEQMQSKSVFFGAFFLLGVAATPQIIVSLVLVAELENQYRRGLVTAVIGITIVFAMGLSTSIGQALSPYEIDVEEMVLSGLAGLEPGTDHSIVCTAATQHSSIPLYMCVLGLVCLICNTVARRISRKRPGSIFNIQPGGRLPNLLSLCVSVCACLTFILSLFLLANRDNLHTSSIVFLCSLVLAFLALQIDRHFTKQELRGTVSIKAAVDAVSIFTVAAPSAAAAACASLYLFVYSALVAGQDSPDVNLTCPSLFNMGGCVFMCVGFLIAMLQQQGGRGSLHRDVPGICCLSIGLSTVLLSWFLPRLREETGAILWVTVSMPLGVLLSVVYRRALPATQYGKASGISHV
ncbi:hypothetical protein KIPB_006218, partial [Kipferlia bialata]